MAEIKSTMEMVLARADRMAERATVDLDSSAASLEERGMRLAASYLNDTIDNLSRELSSQKTSEQLEIRKGMAQTLLRNIVLPRDETLLSSSKKALQGVLDTELPSGEVSTICAEIEQILEQYGQHKEQVKQQLKDSIRAQLEQKLGQHPELGDHSSINPAMHPQYQEELAKMEADLNEQYTKALDQRKEMLITRLS